jgi:hypothetical protein
LIDVADDPVIEAREQRLVARTDPFLPVTGGSLGGSRTHIVGVEVENANDGPRNATRTPWFWFH